MGSRKAILWLIGITIWLSGFMTAKAFAEVIDCNKAVAEQTGVQGQGQYNVCIDTHPAPKVWKKSSPMLEVTSWFGSEEMGYYPMNHDTTMDKSKWRSNVTGEPRA
jgi:hypothetical protein